MTLPSLFDFDEYFVRADNKLEAVIRISNLTNSGPQDLGSGSKERKSVLINLARGMGLHVDEQASKPELGQQIAIELGTLWDESCWSAGQTITLEGLNRLLEAGWRRQQGKPTSERPLDFNDEAARIGNVVLSATPRTMEGRKCIQEMRDAGSTNWRQTEWPGWYFEFVARNALIAQLGGGPIRIGVTEFDYSLNKVWDLKVHSSRGKDTAKGKPGPVKDDCLLNDKVSMEAAIGERGLGLIVLSGGPSYDLDFQSWHLQLRGKTTEVRRLIKSEFTPERLELFIIPDSDALAQAIEKKCIGDFKQGVQQSGQPRPPKFKANLRLCRENDLQVYEHQF